MPSEVHVKRYAYMSEHASGTEPTTWGSSKIAMRNKLLEELVKLNCHVEYEMIQYTQKNSTCSWFCRPTRYQMNLHRSFSIMRLHNMIRRKT